MLPAGNAGAARVSYVTDRRNSPMSAGAVRLVDHRTGQLVDLPVAVAGTPTEMLERRLRSDAEPLRQHALGLLDEPPGVQRRLQLGGEATGCLRLASLQQAGGGHVGDRLRKPDLVDEKRSVGGPEEVDGAEGLQPAAHRHSTDPRVAALHRSISERRPALGGHGERGLYRRLPVEEVQAGALLMLEREHLEQLGALVGGRDRAESTVLVGQHDTRRVDVELLDAVAAEPVQDLTRVRLRHQGGRQLGEGRRQLDLALHGLAPSQNDSMIATTPSLYKRQPRNRQRDELEPPAAAPAPTSARERRTARSASPAAETTCSAPSVPSMYATPTEADIARRVCGRVIGGRRPVTMRSATSAAVVESSRS